MSVAPSPLAVLLLMPCPCLFHFGQQLSTVMLLSHVCGTQSIGRLTFNAMPMSVSLWPKVVHCYVAVLYLWHPVHWLSYLLVMPCPCLFHFGQQLSTVMLLSHACGTQCIYCLSGNALTHVRFTLSISRLTVMLRSLLPSFRAFNPLTAKSDQFQISPAASPEI